MVEQKERVIFNLGKNKSLIPACQSSTHYTFLFVSLLLTLRHLQEIDRERNRERERERERERCISLSPPHPLREEFFLYQKLCDWLDCMEKVDKSTQN